MILGVGQPNLAELVFIMSCDSLSLTEINNLLLYGARAMFLQEYLYK